jgi:chitinase
MRICRLLLIVSLLLHFGCGSGGSGTPAGPVTVEVSPTAAIVLPGGTQTLTATVSGSSNTAVSWSIQEGPAWGSVTSAGVYMAPANVLGTVHVIATSQADPNATGVAAISIGAGSASGTVQ